jgi:hypothetical protein
MNYEVIFICFVQRNPLHTCTQILTSSYTCLSVTAEYCTCTLQGSDRLALQYGSTYKMPK